MKKIVIIPMLLLGVLLCTGSDLFASDWAVVVDFEGYWKFSVGDDAKWAASNYNDNDWDKVYVPARWEKYYPDYNGYAWYRKTFKMRWAPDDEQLTLMLGRIDDVDEVFINGVKIGQTGSFFPNYQTAWNVDRRYNIPRGILKQESNVIAVRVFDEGGDGGIVNGDKIGIFYDNDISLLSYNLEGKWKFSIYRQQGMYNLNFDDSNWNDIEVPGNWEDQGFNDYDGYAWYRKVFSVSQEETDRRQYLVLGRIDDYDKVYLNGKLIARTEDLEHYNRYNAWRLYRVYKIPSGMLRENNVLVIEVKDAELKGGIYEGPVGLASYQDAKEIEERNENQGFRNKLEGVVRYLFDF